MTTNVFGRARTFANTTARGWATRNGRSDHKHPRTIHGLSRRPRNPIVAHVRRVTPTQNTEACGVSWKRAQPCRLCVRDIHKRARIERLVATNSKCIRNRPRPVTEHGPARMIRAARDRDRGRPRAATTESRAVNNNLKPVLTTVPSNKRSLTRTHNVATHLATGACGHTTSTTTTGEGGS